MRRGILNWDIEEGEIEEMGDMNQMDTMKRVWRTRVLAGRYLKLNSEVKKHRLAGHVVDEMVAIANKIPSFPVFNQAILQKRFASPSSFAEAKCSGRSFGAESLAANSGKSEFRRRFYRWFRFILSQ